MRKAWLLFSQTVTVAVALLFVVATLKPQWLGRGGVDPLASAASAPTAVVPLPAPVHNVALIGPGTAATGYSVAAKRASPAGDECECDRQDCQGRGKTRRPFAANTS